LPYQETGRFGRITKNLRKLGFENRMEPILHDSSKFSKLRKTDQAKYVELVVSRIVDDIGLEDANRVLYECGAQCCGKSWSGFAKRIWEASTTLVEFVEKLNTEEEKYSTHIEYSSADSSLTVERTKCICGLVNKGLPFDGDSHFCSCSLGHMAVFFGAVLSVDRIELEETISAGSKRCRWRVFLQE
jgi:hypothetical protein